MNRLSHNILYNLVGQFLRAIIGFFAFKYVLQRLGSDAFGIIIFVQVMDITLSTVLERGIASTTTREVASYPRTDPYLIQLLRTASLFYWATFFLLAVSLFAAAPFIIRRWFNLTTMDPVQGIYIFRLLGLASLLVLPRSLYGSLIRGMQRMEINNLIDVLTMLIQQVGIILILVLKGQVLHVVYWMALCFILSTLAYIIVTASCFSKRALIPGYYPEAVHKNREFASKMTAISVLAMIITQVDKVVMSKFLAIGVVGYYALAFNIISKMKAFTGASALAAFPSFSGYSRGERHDVLLSQYQKLQNLNAVVNFLVFAGFAILQYPVYSYFLNKEAAGLLTLPTLFLCIGSYMNSMVNIPYTLSIAAGAPDITLRSSLYSLVFVTPITIFLTVKWGMLGASLGWLIFNIFAFFYTIPRICRKCIKISVGSWYAAILKVCLLGGTIFGIGFYVRHAAGLYSVLPSIAFFVTSAVAFSAVSYYFVFDQELRLTILQYIGLKKCRP